MASLSDLITSRVRVKVLELFFKNVGEKYHVRGVVREVDEEINAVRIELDRFEKAGILGKENRGNRVYYSIREDYEFFVEITDEGDILFNVGNSEKNRMGNLIGWVEADPDIKKKLKTKQFNFSWSSLHLCLTSAS